MNNPNLYPSLPFIMDGARAMATPAEIARLVSKMTPPLRWTVYFMTAKPPRNRHLYSEEDDLMGMNSYALVRIVVATYTNSIEVERKVAQVVECGCSCNLGA